MKTLKNLLFGGCITATLVLACILPALAVLSFAGFAIAMMMCRRE